MADKAEIAAKLLAWFEQAGEIATGWLLTAAHEQPARDWPLWLLTAVKALIVWRTKLHLLWLIGAVAVFACLVRFVRIDTRR